MNPEIREWLDAPIEGGTQPRIEHIAELCAVNFGRLQVRSWGIVRMGGLYDREGLVQGEALDLLQYGAALSALDMLEPGTTLAVADEIRQAWKRQEARKG